MFTSKIGADTDEHEPHVAKLLAKFTLRPQVWSDGAAASSAADGWQTYTDTRILHSRLVRDKLLSPFMNYLIADRNDVLPGLVRIPRGASFRPRCFYPNAINLNLKYK